MIRKILKLISQKNIISQREIAEYLNISLGSVNKNIKIALLKELILVERISYRESKYILTIKGKEFLKQQGDIAIAVVLLAGKVKKLNTSLGEVFLENQTLVERHIKILEKNKVEKIIFVVEEKNEYYSNLENRHKDIQFIENKFYKKTGNMYSLYLARNYIQEDFLLLDGDLVYESSVIEEILKNLNKNITLIDIREPYEYNEGSIKTSENIPMSNLISTPEDYLDKNDKYYIVCKSGNRSGKLCNILGAEGYNVVNLAGGMMAYKGKNRV